jgi:hypothetical protein
MGAGADSFHFTWGCATVQELAQTPRNWRRRPETWVVAVVEGAESTWNGWIGRIRRYRRFVAGTVHETTVPRRLPLFAPNDKT